MRIEGSVALVTGANRGLGRAFVDELLAAGASKVYAAARQPDGTDSTDRRIVPIRLDLADRDSITAAAEAAADVTLLINNAGLNTFTPVLGDESQMRREFDTNVFGTLAVSRAFAPVLARNDGGTMLNIVSSLAWFATAEGGGYAASKSALWAVTNALRLELREQGTNVIAVHCGLIDTDMASGVPGRRMTPQAVARAALDGVESDAHEVLTDAHTKKVRRLLSEPVEAMYPMLHRALSGQDSAHD